MANRGSSSRVSREEVLAVFRDRENPNEPLTAPEVAEDLDCSRRTVLDKLRELEAQGDLASKKVGARAVVWWSKDANGDDPAPAAPLRGLVGLLDEDAADRARERSREWREAFDDEIEARDGG